MRFPSSPAARATLAGIVLLPSACSTSPSHPGSVGAVGVPDAATRALLDGGGDGGGSPDASSDGSLDGRSAADGSISVDLGIGVSIVDVPNAPCEKPGGVAVTLTSAAEVGTAFSHTGSVGARRFAFGAESQALMTFAPDGSSPSSIVVGPLAAASSGTSLAVVLWQASSIALQMYDESLQVVGDPVAVAPLTADAVSVAAAGDTALVVSRSDHVIGGSLVGGGAIKGSFRLGAYSGGEGACETAAVPERDGFAIVYTAHQHDGRTTSTWALIDASGHVDVSNQFLVADGAHTLFDLARTSAGYVALFGEGTPTKGAVLMALDPHGYVVGQAHRLVGSGVGWSLATNGDALAVAAALDDGRAAFRVFDASLSPSGAWVCIDDSQPGSGFYSQAGVASDGVGWSIVARMTDLSVALRRTDAAGTGAP